MRWLHTALPLLLLVACGTPSRVLPTRVPEAPAAAMAEVRLPEITETPAPTRIIPTATVAEPAPTAIPTVVPPPATFTPPTAQPATSVPIPSPTRIQPTAISHQPKSVSIQPTAISTAQPAPEPQPTSVSPQPPAVSSQTSACATLTFDDLRKRGPRPAPLAALNNGDCVQIKFANGESRYIWRPAGTQMTLASSMYVRWPDGLVSVYQKDGRHVANEFYRGRQNELELLRQDGKLMLPASKSFVFAENGPTVTALVDVLVKVR